MSRTSKRNLIVIGALVAIVAVALWVGRGSGAVAFLLYDAARTIPKEERRILYHVDHAALARELRKFAAEKRWNSPTRSETPDFFYGDDSKLPESLRQFRPGWIQISDDRIDFGCGQSAFDVSKSFGISVWREGLEGHGTKKLADGVWFYAEDGRVPSQFSFP